MSGSPPQIETTGAPDSRAASRHCSTVSSVRLSSYSRIFPQPMQARLHARVGSSISTIGEWASPLRFARAAWIEVSTVMRSGKRTT